jgi:glycosyltransferase involved in cell wall biosynthesis
MQPAPYLGTGTPTVSIGLPVFNGERFLAQALNALLAQTFTDFEIIVSDNASTDSTPEICERFVRTDARVRYVRQAQNIGAPRNWNAVVHEAKGQFFKWASANDYCNECFIEQCLKVLEANSRAVLSFGETILVDQETGQTTDYHGDIEISDARPSDRFKRVCSSLKLNNAQSGLIRLDLLRKTGLDRPYQGGDLVLMCELALYGCFVRAPASRLYRRVGSESMSSLLTSSELQAFVDPMAKAGSQFVKWRQHRDRVAAIAHASIGIGEKLACFGTAARYAVWDRVNLMNEILRVAST